MTFARIRMAATLVLLACLALPSYSCERYIGPDGGTVDHIPAGEDPAQYRDARIYHYPLEMATQGPVQGLAIVLAFTWPVAILVYRRRRSPENVSRWILWLSALLAVASGFVVLLGASFGRPATGTYLALIANLVLLADGAAEALTGGNAGATRAAP